MMKRLNLLLSALFLCITGVFAEIKLPALIGDYMVLQQASKVRLWGEATPNSDVSIHASWDNHASATSTNAQGEWEIWLQTPSAGFTPRQITIRNNEDKVVLHDVLIGEVWFCSGQSNMEMTMQGYGNSPIEGSNLDIATSAKYKSSLRYSTIQRVGATEPQAYTTGGEWQECNPQNTPEFGATAYYFGKLLTEILGVPVGIINCSWGGSSVEGWTPKEILQGYPDIDISMAGNDKKMYPAQQPMIMYNGLLKPASKYTIKGFLWYQGESNVDRPDYAKRLAAMVSHWRELWGQGELPFYEVEIAPYEYKNEKSAYLREQQLIATKLIPNSGMVCTNDLVQEYERHQIHPKEKRTIGQRLCYMALNQTYGYSTITCRGPEYERMEIDKDKVILHFQHVGNGFDRDNGIIGFEIAGKDMRFQPANAKIDGWNKLVIVSAPGVKNPVAVRYCFKDFQVGNLHNVAGLPVIPFRTDH